MKKITGLLLFIFWISLAFAQEKEDKTFDLSLEELMEISISRGKTGSFLSQLAQDNNSEDPIVIRGWMNTSVQIDEDEGELELGFRDYELHLGFASRINEKMTSELLLRWNGQNSELRVISGFLDYQISDLLILRAGIFPVPFGEFNEYLYPSYINKTTLPPNTAEIAVSPWSQPGFQIRGTASLGQYGQIKPFYSLYLISGLSGESGEHIHDMVVRSMEFGGGINTIAAGYKLGVSYGKLTLGTAYYHGRYNEHGLHKDEHAHGDEIEEEVVDFSLDIAGISIALEHKTLKLYTEGYMAFQQVFKDSLNNIGTVNKLGAYSQLSYKINSFEPVVRLDYSKSEGLGLEGSEPEDIEEHFNELETVSILTLGLNYYLNETTLLKMNYFVSTKAKENHDTMKAKVQFAWTF